ncbi:hypothetical protein AGMMS4956_00790 [Bacteroidia bacterium]|nr:hypothetical protein AGMMS4956_00790 [Bacteroidia bacterium]
MKTYLIRVAKYILYFYLLFLLIYGVMYIFSVVPPNLSHVLNQRLGIGLLLVGLCYPFLGFKKITLEIPSGGRGAHEAKICEAVELCGFKVEKREENKIIFVAVSPLRRLLAMYEDRITIEFGNSATLTASGLRKDVAHVRLRINDYFRYAKPE